MATDDEMHKYAAKVPDSHLTVLLIFVIFPRDELRSLMLGAPKVLTVNSIGLAVVLIIDQALQFPQLPNPHKMLCAKVPMPIPIHIHRVNCPNDLIEDIADVLIPQDLLLYALKQVTIVRLSDVSNQFLIGYYRLDIEYIFLEDTIRNILQDFSIELQTFIKAVLFRLGDIDKLGEVTIALLVRCFHHLDRVRTELFDLLAGDVHLHVE